LIRNVVHVGVMHSFVCAFIHDTALFMFLLMALFAMMTFFPPLIVLFLVMLYVKNRNTNEREKNTYIPI
jgi:hypothetical protein